MKKLFLLFISLFVLLNAYSQAGNLDSSFAGKGWSYVDFGTGSSTVTAIAVQPDGKLVAAGTIVVEGTIQDNLDFALARYNPDGSLDSTFSDDGMVITVFGSADRPNDRATSLYIQRDGKIVAVGRAIIGYSYFAIVRYNLNGSLDSTFNQSC